ncbi:hypothetical protein IQ07DRAFT_202074 [Pyrenochaeta sp. DS3sAY3a]|nr:hypothetical protein IQ07DRAFT_202074 [Pyrenochaeta sp. DS3sAY3a]
MIKLLYHPLIPWANILLANWTSLHLRRLASLSLHFILSLFSAKACCKSPRTNFLELTDCFQVSIIIGALFAPYLRDCQSRVKVLTLR